MGQEGRRARGSEVHPPGCTDVITIVRCQPPTRGVVRRAPARVAGAGRSDAGGAGRAGRADAARDQRAGAGARTRYPHTVRALAEALSLSDAEQTELRDAVPRRRAAPDTDPAPTGASGLRQTPPRAAHGVAGSGRRGRVLTEQLCGRRLARDVDRRRRGGQVAAGHRGRRPRRRSLPGRRGVGAARGGGGPLARGAGRRTGGRAVRRRGSTPPTSSPGRCAAPACCW